jgi:hypothetical protein
VWPQSDNSKYLGLSGQRWIELHAVNVYTHDGGVHTSDERAKTDVVDSDLGLDFILALRPIKYRWVDTGSKATQWEEARPKAGVRPHYGLSAQQVKSVIKGKDFGGYVEMKDGTLGLRYTEFIAPLTRAIQELAARVEALEQRVAAL